VDISYQRLRRPDREDLLAAQRGFEQALRRDPLSPHLWTSLGTALFKAGRIEQARYCYSYALSKRPYDAPLLMRAADFYFDQGAVTDALEMTRRVLSRFPSFDWAVFHTYQARGLGLDEILRYGIPVERRAAQAYLREMIEAEDAGQAEIVWNWVTAHHLADDPLASEYVKSLVKHRNYQLAAHSWAGYVGDRRKGYLESTRLFNGDFEFDFSGSLFDWTIREPRAPEVTLDRTIAHSGSRSLRIRFDGADNVPYADIQQVVYVTPGKYRFEAYVRAEALATDDGIGFRIFDREKPSRLDLRTEHVEGTTDWRKIDKSFLVPRDTGLLEIQVVRRPSWRFEGKIRGAVWIDTLRLAPVN
jgi:hypothetical protein